MKIRSLLFIILLMFVSSTCFSATKEELVAGLDTSISVNQQLSQSLDVDGKPLLDANGNIVRTLKDYYENERIGNVYKLIYNLTKHKSDGSVEIVNALMFIENENAYWMNGKPQPLDVPVVQTFTDKIMAWAKGKYIEIKNIVNDKQARVVVYGDNDNDGIATPIEKILYELDNGSVAEGLTISQ